MVSESVLLASSTLLVGVNVPVQVMLSLLLIVESEPDAVPLSKLAIVISAELEKPVTASEKIRVTVGVSPILKI